MGNISREARLCFILLWTVADDSGRLRGNSRMLASLLYPYDADAGSLIDGWLKELEYEDCIMRYQVEGNSYVQVIKWLEHQKIDKPSRSRFPEFDESSRMLANPREGSSEDQGPRTKEGTKEGEGTREEPKRPPESVPQADWTADEEASIPDDLPAAPMGTFILQRLSIPHSYSIAVKFADAVDLLARDEACARGEAARRLLLRARGQPPQDGKWRFWLEDGGWKTNGGTNGNQDSADQYIEGLRSGRYSEMSPFDRILAANKDRPART